MKRKTSKSTALVTTTLPPVQDVQITSKARPGTTPRQPSYRLTDGDRHHIIHHIVNATFDPVEESFDKDKRALALLVAKHYNQPGAQKAIDKAVKAVAHLPPIADALRRGFEFRTEASLVLSKSQIAEQLGAEATKELSGGSCNRDGETYYEMDFKFGETKYTENTRTYTPYPGFPTEVVIPAGGNHKGCSEREEHLPANIKLALAKLLYINNTLNRRRHNMAQELHQQLSKVTTSQHLVQLWPDLAPVVNQHFANKEHVHVPLTDIIKKYAGAIALTFNAESVNKE